MKQFIEEQTRQRLEKLDQTFEAAAASLDPGTVHHLRVAIRRVIQCLRLVPSQTEVAKLRKKLDRVLKRCGAVRDCDVTLQLLATARVRDPRLKAPLQTQRGAAEQKLAKRVARWRNKRLHVQFRGKPTNLDLPKMVQAWFEAGDAALQGDAKSLHRFRLLGKRLRYTAELFAGDPQIDHLLQRLRSAQDQLGAINDCATALPIVRGHPKAEAALTRLLETRKRKFRTAWTRQRKDPWSFTFSATAKPNKPNPTQTAS